MQYTALGNLNISRIGLGTAAWGQPYGFDNGVDLDTARAILNQAAILGINLIDTARTYGQAEQMLGTLTGGVYKDFVLCTKLAPYFYTESSAGAIRKHVRKSIRDSLEALRTEHIDILMVHNLTVDDARNETLLDELQHLKTAGVASYIGGSIYDHTLPLRAPHARYDVLEVAYNALDRRVEYVLPQRHFGYIARSVFLRGALTSNAHSLDNYPRLSELRAKIRALRSLALDFRISLAELTMRYVLGNKYITTALTGAQTVDELEFAAGCLEEGMLQSELQALIKTIRMDDEEQLWPGKW